MDRNDIAQKIAIVHCLIDELNVKGVAISSVTLGNDARHPEFHGHAPIVAILRKYCDEIVAVKRKSNLKVCKQTTTVPRDIEMLKEPLTERSRGELRSHVFTLVKMWQNLDKDQVDYTLVPPFWPSNLPFSQPSSKLLRKGELIEAIRHIYAVTAQHPPTQSAAGAAVSHTCVATFSGQLQGLDPVDERQTTTDSQLCVANKLMAIQEQEPVPQQHTAGSDSQPCVPEKSTDVIPEYLAAVFDGAHSQSHTEVPLQKGTSESHLPSSEAARQTSGWYPHCAPHSSGDQIKDPIAEPQSVCTMEVNMKESVSDHGADDTGDKLNTPDERLPGQTDSPVTQAEDHSICSLSSLNKQTSSFDGIADDTTLLSANYEGFQTYLQYMANFRAKYSDILQWRAEGKCGSDDDDMENEETLTYADATTADGAKSLTNPADKTTLSELIHGADNLNISMGSGPSGSQSDSDKYTDNLARRKEPVVETSSTNMSSVSCSEVDVIHSITMVDMNGSSVAHVREVNSRNEKSGHKGSENEQGVLFNSVASTIQNQRGTDKCEINRLGDDARCVISSTPDEHADSPKTQGDTNSKPRFSSGGSTEVDDRDENSDDSSTFNTTFLNWDDDGDPEHLNYILGPHLARDTETGVVSSIYYDPARKGRHIQDAWVYMQGERVVSLQDGSPSVGTFPVTNGGLPWTRTAFLTYYQDAVDTCIAQERVVSTSRKKDSAASGNDADFDTFFESLVKKVPPAGLLMADIGDISIRLLDYKRKRFVLKDISTIEVQFDDEADMNAVWEKVRDAYQDLFLKKASLKKKTPPAESDVIFKKPLPGRAPRTKNKTSIAEDGENRLRPQFKSASLPHSQESMLLQLPAPRLSTGFSSSESQSLHLPVQKKSKHT